MTERWKAFWEGILAALAALGTGFGLIAFLRRKAPVSSSKEIADDAEKKIDATRAEIKTDSDQALADRFNRLAKKGGKR